MRFLIFIHSLSAGGAERVTTNLANYWVQNDHHITIVTMTSIDEDFYELHPDIKRIPMNCTAESGNVLVAVQHNVKRVLALRKILVREQPDVALGMMTTANCLLALAANGTGIPTIGSERIHPPTLVLGPLWEWLRRKTYPHLKGMVALTSQSADWLKKNACAKQTVIIPNPISYPLSKHSPIIMPEEFCGEKRKLLLAVGRLSHQKGYGRLLTGFSQLTNEFPDWDLAIVGEGAERGKLEHQVKALGLQKRVFLTGRVGNIGDWYEAADVYVMTSLFEGFPNTLAEALAHGVPVVSADCDTGPRDIIRHRIDGFLVPQNDKNALVQALGILMEDETLRCEFAVRAIEIRDRFSMERISTMWEQLFAEVSSKQTKRR